MPDKDTSNFGTWINMTLEVNRAPLFVRSSGEQESSKGFLGERAIKLRPKVVSCSGKGEEGAEKRAKKDSAGRKGSMDISTAKACTAHWENYKEFHS